MVVPAMALLGQRSNTRIFQEMTVPQILVAVLEDVTGTGISEIVSEEPEAPAAPPPAESPPAAEA